MQTLVEDIETLIETNASDFEISKRFKQAISIYLDSLPDLFAQTQGKDFLVRHTKALDQFIIQMYKTVLRRMFGNYLPMRNAIPISLMALGSYGREQLSVYSDIDLMIVYVPLDGYNTEAIIEKFLYLAWDAGLKLGHRVHKVSELFDAADEDITIRTAMMEARFIVGSNFTWHSTQRELGRIRRYEPRRFIEAKLAEAETRQAKYPVSMQPNIKEGVGGMRDSQLLYWVAKTRYDVTNLKELDGTIFTEESYRAYRIALELIFRVRSALHLVSGKQNDQLNLEYLPKVRKMLGFSDDMKLATQVIEAMWRIHNFSSIFVTKMIRPMLYDASRLPALRGQWVQRGIFVSEDKVFASFHLKAQPIESLLNILVSLDDRPYCFDDSFVSQFTYTSVSHPRSNTVKQLLRKLFEREHTYGFLRLFYDAGILAELIPALKKALFLPQFDGYHHYPVGLHSIQCIKAFESIDDPDVKALYDTISLEDRTMLKIIVLLHDAGKGRKLDHSEVGVKLIRPVMQKMGFSAEITDDAALLVRHHILMSIIAQRHNIHSEKTLYKFMSIIKTPRLLTLLYILTYADMSGVGPGTYNAFNAKLLNELYHSSLEVAQEKERITDAARRLKVEQRIQRLDTFKALPRLLQKKILSVESNIFFSLHSPEEILQIAQRAREVKAYQYALDFSTGLSIEILRKIPLNLTYLLGRLGYLDVVSMEVFTLFDDVKYFKIDFLQTPTPDMYESIREVVEESFDMQRSVSLEAPDIKPDQITIDCEHSKSLAELAVHTANQRGLLAFIIQCLDALDMQIVTAKIHTTKRRARDHFLIEKTPQMCNNADRLIPLLCKGNA
ncbi:HD domain-containing protein [Sulfurimonas sp. HSL-3221]|uniref:[protein-PII] uridylyltransferase family protein n=1 Tax=Thiomicrolovo sulfuroxydans TaxID=2894755 RepID=UPI001E4145D0|nr:HD domain-containing protein [Sulfurimonas sp. HSL-3221]UFS62188.1 HD domain-containing protein [Sulfurimonas sp. HSL-3221]